MGGRRRARPAAGTPAGRGEPRQSGWRRAGLAALAIACVTLAVVAFRFHPIGDYFTESDFYGRYAHGADLVRHGRLDPARYDVAGPVYEVALALVGTVTGDAFLAARVISVVSACAILALGWWTTLPLGAAAAFWLVVFVAVNPVFFRYGYSATTDMLATGLGLSSMFVLLGAKGRRAALLGGLLAGLAALTRYNLVCFVPAGVVALLAARSPWRERWAGVAVFLAASALVIAPYTWYAVASGHPPGITLATDARFYMSDTPGQELESRYRRLAVPGTDTVAAVPAPARSLPLRLLTNIPAHLRGDANDLLGWPTAALVLLALGFALRRRHAGPLLRYLPFWAFGFLALAPVFYSDRYSLILVPLYLMPAALWLAEPATGRDARWARGLAAALAFGAAAHASFTLQRNIYVSIPTEALGAGRLLRAVARPGERVLARKAHVAWVAGLEPVLFPQFNTLDSLARFCREQDIRYLYFSWYESRIRPQFAYLLDTSRAVPGLVPLDATSDKPSVTYAIGPDFGRTPLWALNPGRRLTEGDAGAWIRTLQDSGYFYAERASDLLAARRPVEGLAAASAAARLLPRAADPEVLRGEALVALGRPQDALAAFERALELRPDDIGARLGRGWTLYALGYRHDAAEVWRPLIGSTGDPSVLRAMVELYTERGDTKAAAAAQAALERLPRAR